MTKEEELKVYGTPLSAIEFLQRNETVGSAFWLRLEYIKKSFMESDAHFKHSVLESVVLKSDDNEGELRIVRSADCDIHFIIDAPIGIRRPSVRFRQSGSLLPADKHYEINKTLNLLMHQLEGAYEMPVRVIEDLRFKHIK